MQDAGAGDASAAVMEAEIAGMIQRNARSDNPCVESGDFKLLGTCFKGAAGECLAAAFGSCIPELRHSGGSDSDSEDDDVPQYCVRDCLEFADGGCVPHKFAHLKRGGILDELAAAVERAAGLKPSQRLLLGELRRRIVRITRLPASGDVELYRVPDDDPNSALRGQMGVRVKPGRRVKACSFIAVYGGEVRFRYDHNQYQKQLPRDWALGEPLRSVEAWLVAGDSYAAEVEHFNPKEELEGPDFPFAFEREAAEYGLCVSAVQFGDPIAMRVNAPQRDNPFLDYRPAPEEENTHLFEVKLLNVPLLVMASLRDIDARDGVGRQLQYDYGRDYFEIAARHMAAAAKVAVERQQRQAAEEQSRREAAAAAKQWRLRRSAQKRMREAEASLAKEQRQREAAEQQIEQLRQRLAALESGQHTSTALAQSAGTAHTATEKPFSDAEAPPAAGRAVQLAAAAAAGPDSGESDAGADSAPRPGVLHALTRPAGCEREGSRLRVWLDLQQDGNCEAFEGCLAEVIPSGKFHVVWDDGAETLVSPQRERHEFLSAAPRVAAARERAAAGASRAAAAQATVGWRLEVFWPDGEGGGAWYNGSVTHVCHTGLLCVLYSDGKELLLDTDDKEQQWRWLEPAGQQPGQASQHGHSRSSGKGGGSSGGGRGGNRGGGSAAEQRPAAKKARRHGGGGGTQRQQPATRSAAPQGADEVVDLTGSPPVQPQPATKGAVIDLT